MLHREKRIGKSVYTIVKTAMGYTIMEKYDNGKEYVAAVCPRTWDEVDGAITELRNIRNERQYTDTSRKVIRV